MNRLESEAFKKKVHDTLKENKVHDSLMAVVRLKLVEKLGAETGDKLLNKGLGNLSLTDKLCFSMIRNYLISKQMLMTVSVLDPEVGHQANLDDNQVAGILCKNRPGFLSMVRQGSALQGESSALLASLLEGILDDKLEKYDSSTQTITSFSDFDLDQKLMMLEENFHMTAGRDIKSDKQVFEDRLRMLEDRYKKELSLETNRIRDVEAVKIRAEESKKWREKLQEERDTLERNYNDRLNGLREIERKALDQYTEKVRRLEEEYSQKVKSLNLHIEFSDKEFGVKQTEMGLIKSDVDRQIQALHVMEKEIRTRERAVSLQESTFESRVKQDVETYKAVTLREISDKKESVDNKLRKLEEELRGIEEMRRRMQNMAERNLKLEKEIEDERRVNSIYSEKRYLNRRKTSHNKRSR